MRQTQNLVCAYCNVIADANLLKKVHLAYAPWLVNKYVHIVLLRNVLSCYFFFFLLNSELAKQLACNFSFYKILVAFLPYYAF